jgi:hypothetical protein
MSTLPAAGFAVERRWRLREMPPVRGDLRTCVDLPSQFPKERGKEALIPDRLAPFPYEMTATAFKVNASIARHSLSGPPGVTNRLVSRGESSRSRAVLPDFGPLAPCELQPGQSSPTLVH